MMFVCSFVCPLFLPFIWSGQLTVYIVVSRNCTILVHSTGDLGIAPCYPWTGHANLLTGTANTWLDKVRAWIGVRMLWNSKLDPRLLSHGRNTKLSKKIHLWDAVCILRGHKATKKQMNKCLFRYSQWGYNSVYKWRHGSARTLTVIDVSHWLMTVSCCDDQTNFPSSVLSLLNISDWAWHCFQLHFHCVV